MSDVINFNEIKDKATDKDLDKFEQYIYTLYASVFDGTLTMVDFSKRIKEYMEKNNISKEKFLNIQNKLMEKYSKMYGVDFNNIKNQMKSLGIDLDSDIKKVSDTFENLDYESIRKNMSFSDKYSIKPITKQVSYYNIKNKINDIDIELNSENVFIKSNKKVDLKDNELNEFLCSYKKIFENKKLKIQVCENMSVYEY